MRANRLTMAAGLAASLLAPTLVPAQEITPAQILRLAPAQKDVSVDYDTPASQKEIDACKAVLESDAKTGGFTYVLRDGQGHLLRRFSDTNGKKDAGGRRNLDQWSYYKDGFEVYREVDLDDDKYADESRWINTGGTKIAALRSNRVVGWKRISAEEASKVAVQALVANNAALLETVMVTPEELAAIGAPKALVERETQARAAREAGITAVRKGLVGWDAQTVWMRFDGTMPHVIPADSGLKDDLLLYENAFVFAGPASGEADPRKVAYLQLPEVVKLGENWKLLGLPRAVNPTEPMAVTQDSGIRAALAGDAPGAPDSGAADPQLAMVLKELAEHDAKAPAFDAGKQDIATFHYQRIKVLDKALKIVTADEDRINYNKQVIDSLAAAYQTGLYKPAEAVLAKFGEQPPPIGSYAAYRKILAEYTLAANDIGANFIQVQKDYLSKLEGFLEKYPTAEEGPEVLFQLASINEFNAEEDKARTFYAKLAEDRKDTSAGKKAAGALRRLDLIGKPLELSGPTLSGKPLSTTQFKSKPYLVVFWTSTADPVRRDLPELVKVYEKYKSKGFEIIGVNLDADRATLDAFLKESALPWPQIHEPGGMDSRLADELGIITLPTMILSDAEGKVVSRNVRNAADLDRYLEKMFAGPGAAALNLGVTR